MSKLSQFKSKSSLDKVKSATATQKFNNEDAEKFWKPTKDKLGNANAVIRFLPNKNPDDVPFVKLYTHGFKEIGGWYIENCPTTIGKQECPVCQENSKLWATGTEENQKIVRNRKRQLGFISNIYVVKDSGNPENEGKVFLFKYGAKIYEKIKYVLEPEEDSDEDAVNPFDLFDGANFRLKVEKVAGYDNYDKSKFDRTSALLGGDETKLEEVIEKLEDINDFIKPERFKSFDELVKRYAKVLNVEVSSIKNTNSSTKVENKDLTNKIKAALAAQANEDDDDDFEAKLKAVLESEDE